jgi:hypothetical protein
LQIIVPDTCKKSEMLWLVVLVVTVVVVEDVVNVERMGNYPA